MTQVMNVTKHATISKTMISFNLHPAPKSRSD